MTLKTRLARVMTLACTVAVAGCIHPPEIPPVSGAVTTPGGIVSTAVPFTFDDNRMFLPIVFVRPDGSSRPVMAFVNQGSVGPVLSPALFHELGIDQGKPLLLRIGTQTIRVEARAVQTPGQSMNFRLSINPFSGGPFAPEKPGAGNDMMAELSGPLHVEAILPSGVLRLFDTAFDYGARRLTLAPPGTLPHDGIALPIRVNPKTGFVTLDLTIDGKPHPAVIDNGGSYSVIQVSLARTLAAAHPDWVVSDTAIGEANLTGSPADVGAPVLRLHGARIGAVALGDPGISAQGAGSMLQNFVGGLFWDFYSAKAGEPVEAWLGGNVLADYRITFDYAHRMSWWQRERDPDPQELDQVGITLQRDASGYFIGAVATKNGKPTVADVEPGDRLTRIDGQDPVQLTRGALFAALHGAPGTTHRLTIERNGTLRPVDALVSAF